MGEEKDHIRIHIPNWTKYNSDSERNRHPSWFLLINSTPISHGLIGLTPQQKWVWICLLCECSRKNADTLHLSLRWLSNFSGVNKSDILKAFEILQENESLSVDCQSAVKQPPENSLHTNRQTDIHTAFDFDILYKAYPRKIGKTAGIKTAQRSIKTEEEYLSLKRAIENYVVLTRESEPKFIKHFSTFMNCWRDYVEIEVPTKSNPNQVLDDDELAAIKAGGYT